MHVESTTVLLLILPVTYTCPDGQYHPKNGTCTPCDAKCVGGQTAVANCTKTENLKCDCPKGAFFDTLKHRCGRCRIATGKQFYKRNCSRFENAVVYSCPLGQYTTDHYQCHNCTICPFGQKMVTDCDGTNNVVCQKISVPDKTRLQADEIAGIVLAILVVLCIALMVMWCFYRGMLKKTCLQCLHCECKDNQQTMDGIPAGADDSAKTSTTVELQMPEKSSHKEKKADYHRACSTISENGVVNPLADRGDGLATISDISLEWTVQKVNDLQWTEVEEIAVLLSLKEKKNDWHQLASELGFPLINIMHLEVSNKAAFEMLTTYGTFENSSVENLYNALMKIGRHDACKVLAHYIRKKSV